MAEASRAAVTRRLPMLALLTGNALSETGNVLTLIAVPWFVLATTGSAAKTGLTGFAAIVPSVLAAVAGGAVVDRVGFKRMSIVADLASGVTIALIPLLHHTVGLAFWQLLGLVFLGTLLDAPGTTARTSLLPDLAALGGMSLERVNAFYQGIQRGALLVGPPLAGLLIAAVDASNVLWVDAASFAVSALLVGLAVPARRRARAADARDGTLARELLQGLAFIRRSRMLVSLLVTVAILNFLQSPIFPVVLPVYARERYGSAVDLGLLVSAFGAGAVAGVFGYGVLAPRLPRRETFIVAFILAGLPCWILAAGPRLEVAAAAMLLTGLAAGPINPIFMTILQERVPVELRGRVFGAVIAIAMSVTPLGMLLQGYTAQQFGVRAILAVIAAACLIVTLSMLANPSLREMNQTPAAMPAAGDAAELPSAASTLS